MPRNIPTNLNTHLQGDVLTVALCTKLTRRDGTVMGFTSVNVQLTVDSVDYEPDATVSPSALRSQIGGAVDNLEVIGLIQSDRVTVTDIQAGRYAHAQVELFLVNYAVVPVTEKLIIFEGRVGEISWNDQFDYTFELRSLGQRIAQQIVDLTSPKCRVKNLFNAQCFVGGQNFDATHTAADFQFTRTVGSVQDTHTITFAADSNATGYYKEGRVHFNTGANAGLEREVKSHTLVSGTAQIVVHEAFPFAVLPGDQALLEAGCDRTIATCRDRFANVGNYRGEPYIPGFDLVNERGRK